MNNIYTLRLAYNLMGEANRKHENEIFMDVTLKEEDECIEFDILTSSLEHATQLCGLLNLTLHIEANTDPGSDKTLNFYIN